MCDSIPFTSIMKHDISPATIESKTQPDLGAYLSESQSLSGFLRYQKKVVAYLVRHVKKMACAQKV